MFRACNTSFILHAPSMNGYEEYEYEVRQSRSNRNNSMSSIVSKSATHSKVPSDQQSTSPNITQKWSVPLLFKYLLFHHLIIAISIAIFFAHPMVGGLILSIIPSLSIISCITHLLLSQFRDNPLANSIFNRKFNYCIGVTMCILGMFSFIGIKYLSDSIQPLIDQSINARLDTWLQSPPLSYLHITKQNVVFLIVSPILQELCKWMLIALTLPMKNIWNLGKNIHVRKAEVHFTAKSLLVTYIAVWAASGFTIADNLVCGMNADEWSEIHRVLLMVPFQCMTAGVIAIGFCKWICLYYHHFGKECHEFDFGLCLWQMCGVVSVIIPILLHIAYNWCSENNLEMGMVAIMAVCFMFVAFRMYRKYRIIQTQDLIFVTSVENGERQISDVETEYEKPEQFTVGGNQINMNATPPAPLSLPVLSELRNHMQNQNVSDPDSDDDVVLYMQTPNGLCPDLIYIRKY
eukprot:211688_1